MISYAVIGLVLGIFVTTLYFKITHPTVGKWEIDEFHADKDIFKLYFTSDPSIMFTTRYAVFEVSREKNTGHND